MPRLSAAVLVSADETARLRLYVDRDGLIHDLTALRRQIVRATEEPLGDPLDLPYWRARLGYWLAFARYLDDDRRAKDEIVTALAAITAADQPDLTAKLLAGLSAWECRFGHRRNGLALLEQAIAIADLVPEPRHRTLRARLHNNLAVTVLNLGDVDAAFNIARQVCETASDLPAALRERLYATAVMIAAHAAAGLPGVIPRAPVVPQRLMANIHAWSDAADVAGTEAAASGAPGLNRHLATYALARRAQLGGDADAALDAALDAVQGADECGEPDTRDSARVLAAELLADAGRHAEALDHLDAVAPVASAERIRALCLRATCLEALDDLHGALDSLREYIRRARGARTGRVRDRGAVLSALLQRDAAAQERDVVARERDVVAQERDAAVRRSQEASRLARVDPLTGIANRLAFDEALESFAERQLAVVLALVDLDRFKSINDAWGHPVGDEVLRRVAGALRDYVTSMVDPGEHVYRIGGEELAILTAVGRRDDDWVETFADGARLAVERIDLTDIMPGMRVTTSIGVAAGTPPRGDEPGNDLAAQADHNLYKAKRRGRNRVVAG